MTPEEKSILDDLLEVEVGMSGREIDFIKSMDEHRDREITERQHDWLLDLGDELL